MLEALAAVKSEEFSQVEKDRLTQVWDTLNPDSPQACFLGRYWSSR